MRQVRSPGRSSWTSSLGASQVRRNRPTTSRSARPTRRSPMSEPIALLVNPAAGKGRALRAAQEAGQVLSGHGYEVRVLSGPDPAGSLELARQIVADGETLVAVGGDGLGELALRAGGGR